MTWTLVSSQEKFPAAAEAWLLRDPVRNTVPLTVLRGIRTGLFIDDVMLGWHIPDHVADGEIDGVALHTQPFPLLLGAVDPGLLAPLATELIALEHPLAGVTGPVAQAEAFAGAWWRPETDRRSERLYRLGVLADIDVPGSARTADADDIPRVVEWLTAFANEADPGWPPRDLTPAAAARINRGELVWWEDGGEPVSLAGCSMPIAGMSRIGPVYTPPEHRRQGYGSAVTHACSVRARAAGAAEVLLFTDLANPTSNSIYQTLGYVPIGDHASIHFT
ncbi:GNAT family N-acetyltransferase [Streptosporangiaceae bacterium NEAU-GS5]|nr:GNAT family N-acetyltransferase [Streptosporangiaceae bacterium NEAU-GS5]